MVGDEAVNTIYFLIYGTLLMNFLNNYFVLLLFDESQQVFTLTERKPYNLPNKRWSFDGHITSNKNNIQLRPQSM
jgi:hypothetical protein